MVQVRLLALIAAASVVVVGCDFGTEVVKGDGHPEGMGNARMFTSIHNENNVHLAGHAQPFAGPQIKGSGPVKSETRTIGAFNLVDVGANFEVDVQVGPKPSMKLSAQQNILPHISAKVVNQVLKITYSAENISTDKPVKVVLTTPRLIGVDVSGAAQMNVKGLNTSDFAVDASGASKLTVAGTASNLVVDGSGAAELQFNGFKCKSVEADLSGASKLMVVGSATDVRLDLSGAGEFKGQNLAIEKAVVDSSGAANAFLNVRNTLKVKADGGSNIKYRGGAKTTIESSGAASVGKA